MLKPTQEQLEAQTRLLYNDDFSHVLKYCKDEALIALIAATEQEEILKAHCAYKAIHGVFETVLAMDAYAKPKKEE